MLLLFSTVHRSLHFLLLALCLAWMSNDFLCLLKGLSYPMTTSADSSALQVDFTSPLFKNLLGASCKFYLLIPTVCAPGAPSSLNTWSHCDSLTSLFLGSVIFCDIYGVAWYESSVGHYFFEKSIIHFIDLLIPCY